MEKKFFFTILAFTLLTANVQSDQLPSGVQLILDTCDAEWAGLSGPGNSCWSFNVKAGSDRVCVTVGEGCTPEQFKLYAPIARGAVIMYLVEQKNPSLMTYRPTDMLEPPPAAQALAAYVNAAPELAGAMSVQAVCASPDGHWQFYCKSKLPDWPNVSLYVPAYLSAEEFYGCYVTGLDAVVQYRHSH